MKVTPCINLRLFRSAVLICLAFGGAFDAGAAEPSVATSNAPTLGPRDKPGRDARLCRPPEVTACAE